MSRHRNFRGRYTTDDLSDEGEDYYEDEEGSPYSPTLSQFMYNRGNQPMGNKQNLDKAQQKQREEEEKKNCLAKMREYLKKEKETFKENDLQLAAKNANYQFKEAIQWYYNNLATDEGEIFSFDEPVSVKPTQPSAMGLNLQVHKPNTNGNYFFNFAPSPLAQNDDGIVRFDFSTPSPDDVILEKQRQVFSKKKDQPINLPPKKPLTNEQNQPKVNTNQTQQNSNQPKQTTNQLKLQNSNPSKQPTTNPKPTQPAKFVSKNKAPQQKGAQPSLESVSASLQNLSIEDNVSSEMKLKIKNKDVKQHNEARRNKILAMYNEKKNEGTKPHINVVVIGHVDAGKSTIMGHLLYKLGYVDKKTINKYERDAQSIGKNSFHFAWVLDEHGEERQRGITIDVAVREFETKTKSVTLLDAPGHRDFVPNMITGAAQADAAILVLSSGEGEFESGFKPDGQTREHIQLAKSLGVDHLIIAVNKLDLSDWSEARYKILESTISPFIKKSGFPTTKIRFVPCSGFVGENLSTKSTNPNLTSWYQGPCLVDLIDAVPIPERPIDLPLRLVISDVYKDTSAALGIAVGGRVEAGIITKDDKLLLLPLNHICKVKAIRYKSTNNDYAVAGQNVDVGLQNIEQFQLSIGSILCDPSKPIPVVTEFRAQIITFADLAMPILQGTVVVFHIQNTQTSAVITKLESVIDQRTGEIKQKRPKCVGAHASAVVVIALDKPVCLELYSSFKQLGRFTLRDEGKSVAAGIVTAILKESKYEIKE